MSNRTRSRPWLGLVIMFYYNISIHDKKSFFKTYTFFLNLKNINVK